MLLLKLDTEDARVLHHALATVHALMEQVDVPPDAPLHGAQDRIARIARRVDHEMRHRGAVPNPNDPDA